MIQDYYFTISRKRGFVEIYIQHTIKQIYKAIHKAHDMLEKAEALYQEIVPIGKNGQWLVNFLEEAKDH